MHQNPVLTAIRITCLTGFCATLGAAATSDNDEPFFTRESFKIGSDQPSTFEWNIATVKGNQFDDACGRFTITPTIKYGNRRTGLNITYLGVYDFYFGSRESGPVISRFQNPYAYGYYEFKTEGKFWHHPRLKFGVAHESNGMYIDNVSKYQKVDSVDFKDFNTQDFASMGWNYFFTEIRNTFFLGKAEFQTYLSYKWMVNQGGINPLERDLEDTIFWDASRGKTSITQFDGIRFLVDADFHADLLVFQKLHLTGYYQTGDLSTTPDGYKVGLKPWFHLFGVVPMFFKFEQGYGRDLSSYYQEYSSMSVGLHLW